MASINLHERIKTKFLQKPFLPIFQKKPLLTIEFLKTNFPPLPLSHSPKPQAKKCFKCLGFGHIDTNCPTKKNDGNRGL